MPPVVVQAEDPSSSSITSSETADPSGAASGDTTAWNHDPAKFAGGGQRRAFFHGQNSTLWPDITNPTGTRPTASDGFDPKLVFPGASESADSTDSSDGGAGTEPKFFSLSHVHLFFHTAEIQDGASSSDDGTGTLASPPSDMPENRDPFAAAGFQMGKDFPALLSAAGHYSTRFAPNASDVPEPAAGLILWTGAPYGCRSGAVSCGHRR